MSTTIIYALDFDGVICDSAIETGIAGWKSARKIWNDLTDPLPPEKLIDNFRQVRPILETGYESVLLMRLLHQGRSVDSILKKFPQQKTKLLEDCKLEIADLKKNFAETRDHWINSDLENWIEMNPLFPGVKEKLQKLDNKKPWYIITTKQERFVKYILEANQIELSREHIYGLDRNMSKNAVLLYLIKRHDQNEIYFVEDRLPTLLNVLDNSQLSAVILFFALWGYNTDQDKSEARQHTTFKLITLDNFLSG